MSERQTICAGDQGEGQAVQDMPILRPSKYTIRGSEARERRAKVGDSYILGALSLRERAMQRL